MKLLAAVAFMAVSATGTAQSQEVRMATLSERLCATCALTVERAFDVSGREPGQLPPGTAIAGLRSADGGVLVVYGERPNEIVRHTAAGQMTGSFGRQGGGPGEFREISMLRPAADGRIVVVDDGARQAVTYSRDYRELRRFQLPMIPFDMAMTSNGIAVVSGTYNTREAAGYPLHAVDSTGHVVRSFGTDDPVYRPDIRIALTRQLTPGPDGSVWVAHRNQYVVEQWNADYTLARSLRREVDWFRPWVRAQGAMRLPLIVDVAARPDGLLMVLMRVPGDSARSTEADRAGRLYDSLIEFIDPVAARVVGRVQLDPVFTALLDHEHAIQPYAREDLESRTAVWRITFTQRGGR